MLNHIKEKTNSYLDVLIQSLYNSLSSNTEEIILKGEYSSVLNYLINNDYINKFNFIETDFTFLLRNFPNDFNNPAAFEHLGKNSEKYEEELINKLDNNKTNILYGESKSFLNYNYITKIKERIKSKLSKSNIKLKLLILGDCDNSFNRDDVITYNVK